MPFVTATLGTFCIVRFTGEIDIEEAAALGEELKALLTSDSSTEYVLDLSKVVSVDPAAIAAVISAAAWARGKGHQIFLYAPASHVQAQMEAQDVSALFPLIVNEADLFSRLPD